MDCDIPVENVTKVTWVIGTGTTLHKFIESNGRDIFLTCISYHLTQIDVRLFSPQTYHQMHGGHSVVHRNPVIIHFPFHSIPIPVDLGGTNLSVVHNLFVTEHHNWAIGRQIYSLLDYSRLSNLDVFDGLNSVQYIQSMDIFSKKMEV